MRGRCSFLRPAAIASLLALAAFVPAALASRIVFRDVELAFAVRQAENVVRARFVSTVETALHRYRVTRVLRGDVSLGGRTIDVRPAGHSAMAIAAQARATTGVSESPLLLRLASTQAARLVRGRVYCVLLDASNEPATYEYAAEQGRVGARDCAAIERILATPLP